MVNRKTSKYPNWKYLTLVVLFVLIISHPLIAYSFIESNKIESKMLDESAIILNQSDNNSEKAKMIVKWEQEQFNYPAMNHFNRNNYIYYFRGLIPFPGYYLYINKANCGELAIVFEDMADKTNLTYRKIFIDGMLNTKSMKMNNHRFTEVLLENGSWMIADVGFDMYPPKSSKYEFSESGFLVGNVAIINDNGTFTDCTSSYVKNTSKIIINAKRDGLPLSNATVKVELMHDNVTSPNINNIIYKTNESGISELNLGLYNECSYKVTIVDGFYKNSTIFVPEEDISSIDIEVDKFDLFNTLSYILVILVILMYSSFRIGKLLGDKLKR